MRFARCEPVRLHGVGGELGDVEAEHLILRERIIVERVPRVSGLAQIALVERRRIHDDRAADSQIAQLDGEGGGIHRDEHVDRVAGGHHVGAAEMDLECRDAERRAGRARISAGKSGNVEKSLPASAVSSVNWLPVTCIPSPESPANRMTTESRVSRCRREIAEVTMTLIYTTFRSTNHTFAGRSASRRMYQANQALP